MIANLQSPHYCWLAKIRRRAAPCAAQCKYCRDVQLHGKPKKVSIATD